MAWKSQPRVKGRFTTRPRSDTVVPTPTTTTPNTSENETDTRTSSPASFTISDLSSQDLNQDPKQHRTVATVRTPRIATTSTKHTSSTKRTNISAANAINIPLITPHAKPLGARVLRNAG
ncbi:hypothetical protein CVT25_013232 [Psilocybe cyanescens]|uniref:Uncharacterized protein n=1 Tax=Psilocybe cyanescens TaxID=93625 RepID=A0A409X0J7_PSICY|nr:hypothetical protein CVT25_013232 [Psilocybe cyanescens]